MDIVHGSDGDTGMKVFFTRSAEHLKRYFRHPAFKVGRHESYAFADGERGMRLLEGVQGKSTALVASILPDPGSLFDLLVMHRLLRENGALEIRIVVPYLGYARQDRPARKGEGSIGILIAELLEAIGPSRLIVADVHSGLIRNAFGPSMTEVTAVPLIAEALSRNPPEVIVSPDAGSKVRAERLASLLEPRPEIAVIDKVRPRANVAIARTVSGEVRGKDAVVIDDIIDTGGTLTQAVKLLDSKGVRRIRIAATHGIFSADARDRLYRLPIEQILVTNTLPQIRYPKIKVLNIVPIFLREMDLALQNEPAQTRREH